MDEWGNKLWCIQTMEAIKRSKVFKDAAASINMENITVRERNQTKKDHVLCDAFCKMLTFLDTSRIGKS